eukprot:TRINITY_DN29732_c0_g1_i2.p1 TRINITY_DN29732_c0_g1~~TRINITY_DN29732_c0_g1_i2.p1  ORF type:complete len:1067 (-),score=313.67 TRINITY_DN29732_c0_g1_i2:261-3461(-)
MFADLGLKELCAGVTRGFQETIFAYGQTGSGKTHTILGSAGGEPGLLQLCTRELLSIVFGASAGRATCDRRPTLVPGLSTVSSGQQLPSRGSEERRLVQLMCVEIKNEDVVDLLPADLLSKMQQRSSLQGDASLCDAGGTSRGAVSVKCRLHEYQKVTVWSYEEAMAMLQRGIASREVGRSSLNSESSRSHMIVRFIVKTLSTSSAASAKVSEPGVVGTLTLVDLAGNERDGEGMFSGALDSVPSSAGSLGASGTASAPAAMLSRSSRSQQSSTRSLAAAKAINVSLTHLNRMLIKMQNGQLDESDRRQSSLNMVLFESLVEDCGVTMVFCIHPDRRFAHMARSTLQMALRCRRILRQKRVRRLVGEGYQDELAELRSEATALTVAHTEALSARARIEDDLRRTERHLQELKQRYEAQSKDFGVMRADLEAHLARLVEEDREKQSLEACLAQKHDLLKGVIEQLQKRDEQLSVLQRRYEAALQANDTGLVDSQGIILPAAESDSSLNLRAFADKCAAEGYQRAAKEMKDAYDDELNTMRNGYEQELQRLQRELKQQQKCEAATEAGKVPTTSHSGGRVTKQQLQQVASPQRRGGRKVDRALRAIRQLREATTAEAAEASLAQLCRWQLQDKLDAGAASEEALGAASQAMAAFPWSWRTQRDGALLLAELIAKEPSLRTQAVHAGALRLAVNAIEDLGTMLVEESYADGRPGGRASEGTGRGVCIGAVSSTFRLLAVVCKDDGGQQLAAYDLCTVASVVRCMQVLATWSGGHDGLVHGCLLLTVLCSSCLENQAALRDAAGVHLLLSLLQREVASAEVSSDEQSQLEQTDVEVARPATLAAYAVGCLASAAEGSRENQSMMLSGGAMFVLLRLLEKYQQSEMMVKNVSIAVAHIAHRQVEAQNAARLHGGLHALLAALLSYRSRPSVQGAVCRALAVLTEKNLTNQQALLAVRLADPSDAAEVDAVGLLVHAMQQGGGHPAAEVECRPGDSECLVSTACWALANLVADNPAAMSKVRSMHGLTTVHTALQSCGLVHRQFSKEERAAKYICRMLSELAKNGNASGSQG